ncbi:MAG: hypothetical protein ACYC69_04220 [Thermodesulfovibrionales bacterium]
MGQIRWCDALLPGEDIPVREFISEYYDGKIRLERTRALPLIDRQAELPDRRVYRSMSRAGILLSLVCLKAREELSGFLRQDPFRVGVYCAIENGPVDFASTKQMVGVPGEAFAETYKKLFNPKMYLRQLPNLAASQMGIFLNILGPLHVFNNSLYGSLHALQQAELDLADGRVNAALICSAFSFENPLILERTRRSVLKGRVLCEGAGAMLLVPGGGGNAWQDMDYENTGEYFGISHQIISQIMKRRTQHDN